MSYTFAPLNAAQLLWLKPYMDGAAASVLECKLYATIAARDAEIAGQWEAFRMVLATETKAARAAEREACGKAVLQLLCYIDPEYNRAIRDAVDAIQARGKEQGE